jgi:flagellar basal body-associated protein FliL
MATLNDSHSPPSVVSDWLLELLIGVSALMLGTAVWLFVQAGGNKAQQERPRPVWLGVTKVMAQMSDGRMVTVKVNLSLGKPEAIGELQPHMPAFQALIEEAGTRITREDIQGGEGMKRFGVAIQETLNEYLDGQHVANRVKHVLFDELTLMP